MSFALKGHLFKHCFPSLSFVTFITGKTSFTILNKVVGYGRVEFYYTLLSGCTCFSGGAIALLLCGTLLTIILAVIVGILVKMLLGDKHGTSSKASKMSKMSGKSGLSK